MSYGTLISTQTIGAGGAASIDFNSIPQTYTDLIVVTSGKPAASGGLGFMLLKINGSSANFTYRGLEGNGAAASSSSAALSRVGTVPDYTNTAFSNCQLYIPNYAGSTNKAISAESIIENNGTTAFQDLFAVLWSQTAAITSLSLYPESGASWAQYTTASLYGIK